MTGSSRSAPLSTIRIVGGDAALGAALAFVAGFVDAAGFVALAGLFTSHVTGNFVLIGAELVTHSSGVLAKVLALPAFALGVASARLIAVALERRRIDPFRPLLSLQIGVLLGFVVAGVSLSPLDSPDAPAAIFVGMLGVAAMSIQNAVGRISLSQLPATAVMTVNVAQTMVDVVDLCRDRRSPVGERATIRLRRTLPAVVSFAVGALGGAFGVAAWSFWSVLIPIATLVGVVSLARATDAVAPAAPRPS